MATPLVAVGPFDPVSVVLLAAGIVLTVVPSAVVGYLLAGAFIDLFTRQ